MAGGMTPGPGVFSADTPGPSDVWSAQTPHHPGSQGMAGPKDDFQEDDDRHGSSPPDVGIGEDFEDAEFRASTGLPPASASSSAEPTSTPAEPAATATSSGDAQKLTLPPGALVLYRPEGAAPGVDDQEAVVVPRPGSSGDGLSSFVKILMTGSVLEPNRELVKVLPVEAGKEAILLESVSDSETGQPGLLLEAGIRVSCISVDEAAQQAVCSSGDNVHTLFLSLAKLGRWQDPNQ